MSNFTTTTIPILNVAQVAHETALASASAAASSSGSLPLQVIVFAVIIFAFLLFCASLAACFACRRRRERRRRFNASRASTPTAPIKSSPLGRTVISASDLCDVDIEKTQSEDPNRLSVVSAFLEWRHRVLYDSHPIPELAVLPSYKPKESLCRQTLNAVLLKKNVTPDPPTVVSVKQDIEDRERKHPATHSSEGRDEKGSATAVPAIMVHCVCETERVVDRTPSPRTVCAGCSPPFAASSFPAPSTIPRECIPPLPTDFQPPMLPPAAATAVPPRDFRARSPIAEYHVTEDTPVLIPSSWSFPPTSYAPTAPLRLSGPRNAFSPSAESRNAARPGVENTLSVSGQPFVAPPSALCSRASSASAYPSTCSSPSPAEDFMLPTSTSLPVPMRLTEAGSTASNLMRDLLDAIAADTEDEYESAHESYAESEPDSVATPQARTRGVAEEEQDISTTDVLQSYFTAQNKDSLVLPVRTIDVDDGRNVRSRTGPPARPYPTWF